MQISELLNACFEHLRTCLQKSRPMQKLGSDESMKGFMDICSGRVSGCMIDLVLQVGDVIANVTDLFGFSCFAGTAGVES